MPSKCIDRLEAARLSRQRKTLLMPSLTIILMLGATQCSPSSPRSSDDGIAPDGDSDTPSSGGGGGKSDSGGGGDSKGGSGGGKSGSGGGGGGKSGTGGGGGSGGSGGGKSGTGGGGSSGTGGSGGTGGSSSSGSGGSCESLPPAADYGATGPFGDVQMYSNTGPSSNYTLFRPSASLGRNGFKHPIAAWGNGIATTPGLYKSLLELVASHGFVVIACNDTQAERPCLSAGLDWLIEQNKSGAMAGMLDVTREVTIGYSWGGGASNRYGQPPQCQSDGFVSRNAAAPGKGLRRDAQPVASVYLDRRHLRQRVRVRHAEL